MDFNRQRVQPNAAISTQIFNLEGLQAPSLLDAVGGGGASRRGCSGCRRPTGTRTLASPRSTRRPRDELVVHRVPVSGDEVSHAENGVVGAGRENPSGLMDPLIGRRDRPCVNSF